MVLWRLLLYYVLPARCKTAAACLLKQLPGGLVRCESRASISVVRCFSVAGKSSYLSVGS